MPRNRRVITETMLDEADLAAERERERLLKEANEGVTIFDLNQESEVEEKRIDRVHVYRKDPPEGFLAELEPSVTEQDIFARWGGSEFRIEGKNTRGQVVKVKTVRLAGDPVFMSEIWEARWRRSNGLGSKSAVSATPGEQLSMKDVLLLMEERDQRRREEERERQEQVRSAHEEREERRRKDELEREERRRRDENDREDRRKREEAERIAMERRIRTEEEDRRRQQHKEDLERVQLQTQLFVQQQQQMFASTIEMLKIENAQKIVQDPTAMLVKGIELAQQLGGGENGPPSVLNTILSRLPETLEQVRGVAGAVSQEIQANKDAVTIKGQLAEKFKALAAHLAAQGKDPAKVLDTLASAMMARRPPSETAALPPAKVVRKRGRPRKRPPEAQEAAPAPEGVTPIRRPIGPPPRNGVASGASQRPVPTAPPAPPPVEAVAAPAEAEGGGAA